MMPFVLLAAASAPGASVPAVATPIVTSPAPRAELLSTSAFGLTHGRFFNQLLGARLDYGFTPRLSLSAALSYANLEGKDRRVHDVLPELGAACRLGPRGSSLGLPLHVAFGYLPRNGPTLRLSAGVSLELPGALRLELVPLEPMLWVTRDRPELSLDASLALSAAF